MKLIRALLAVLMFLAAAACGGEDEWIDDQEESVSDSELVRPSLGDPETTLPPPGTIDTLPGGEDGDEACAPDQVLCCLSLDICICIGDPLLCGAPSGSCTGAGCRAP